MTIGVIVQTAISILSIIVMLTVKFNDIKHIGEDVSEIKKTIMKHEARISFIEGKLNGKS
jgi:hypothetical protein